MFPDIGAKMVITAKYLKIRVTGNNLHINPDKTRGSFKLFKT